MSGRESGHLDADPAPDDPAERLVSLEGGRNFRDLGGYPTADGGRVRWGQVYRSAALHRLTATDLTTLEELGIRVVFDLRADPERDAAPSLLPDGIRCEPMPIEGTAARTQELSDLVVEGRFGDAPPDFLYRVYEAMAEVAAPTFGRILTRLAEPDSLPALIHCTGGKDRTGMVAALLLSVLGVDEEVIVDDYELSEIHYSDRQIASLRRRIGDESVDVEQYRAVFGAPRDAMSALLTTIGERYGGVGAYLRREAGVEPEVLAELRVRLVEHTD